ncbi:hypothetical protein BHE74_00012790 [Ensete ventricosum]|uniref:BHLH domain-containing protein n=1 Tax=Ensete ventricosum TaxID=4639 RepID=A0A426ZR56_ENSVE|nr:hypothetical protein B296_00011443 [Ensete ventricosum]RWW78950.1 hypothetical protein BHE74_00012790 [Ensete ventricosum]RZR78716.1 hypothetical protein BHM03_00004138 [Ensete ventricosum]
MANQLPHQQPDGMADDFFEQIFSLPSSYTAGGDAGLGGADGSLAGVPLHRRPADAPGGVGCAFPLGLSLEQGSSSGKRLREDPEGKALRRERIAERIRALQDLVPNTNKFLRLQVKVWETCSTDGTERQVAKLMEEDIGAAMQFLQSKALCMMPISLAMAIYDAHQPDAQPVKPEPDTPS